MSKFFKKPVSAQKPKTPESQQIIYLYIFILVAFAVSQLFSFDEFLPLIQSFKLPGGVNTAYIIGTSLVVSEVFALPFLLRLKTSLLMQVFSMALSWFVPLVWLFVSLWLVLTSNSVANIGFIGTVIDLTPGWWAVFISIAIGFTSAWSSWAIWPLDGKK